jgi:asparagine synthase (glutamine-hydrolysing)
MCGILGRIDNSADHAALQRFDALVQTLDHRGPDHRASCIEPPLALGHTRFSIIDLDARSHQPMTDTTGRYTLVFNGEIYNHRELRRTCEQLGYAFRTESDTEVLLVMLIHYGKATLEKLNGFFAFALFDRKDKSLFLARDRFGIKPLVYYHTDDQFAFASEMKALLAMDFKREIDKVSLFTYFKFNYIPAPHTILKGFRKLEPGHCLMVKWDRENVFVEDEAWYTIPYSPEDEQKLNAHDYQQAQRQLKQALRASVQRRLIADVPVGTFLSGGIDSSIITALASEEKNDMESCSIGFPSQPYYDESEYAKKVAKHLNVKHHVFELSTEDLLACADDVLNQLDEPFADSSALNVYLLSQRTREHVKVALSGDGGDELFAGYNKHQAEFRVRHSKWVDRIVGNMPGVWDQFPASRSGKMGNIVRQLQKFADGYQLGPRDRYWRWAGVLTEEEANYLIKEELLERHQRLSDHGHAFKKRKDNLLKHIKKQGTLNEVLLSDMLMVLPNDMLYKVDAMSMAHALEVRTPMLDHHVVKHAFRLPVMFKVNHDQKKKILKDTFSDLLPNEVFHRPKRGFEVPLLEWFQGPMKERFTALIDDVEAIDAQGLFNADALLDLHEKLYSKDPGDAPATAWAFMVFQHWYKRYMT